MASARRQTSLHEFLLRQKTDNDTDQGDGGEGGSSRYPSDSGKGRSSRGYSYASGSGDSNATALMGSTVPSVSTASSAITLKTETDPTQRQGGSQVADESESWPAGVGKLLEQCWAAEAADRPSFGLVLQELQNLEAEFSKVEVEVRQDSELNARLSN